jgi:hypothetical protein
MKKIMKIGSKGTINQTACCASIIVIILKEPVRRITVKIAELRISS